jgi:Leucine-rich repeat (LRR) protein
MPKCLQHALNSPCDFRDVSVAAALNLPSAEISALQSLYNATDGVHWQWQTPYSEYGVEWVFNSTSNPCADKWQGVTCSTASEEGFLHVTELSLNQHALTGYLPAELSGLAYMQALSLPTNALTGTIPAELANITSLTQMDLSSNHLTGPIPSEIGLLSNLSLLYVFANQLTGPLPETLSNLPQLRVLAVSNNQLSGTIPSALGTLQQMIVLRLTDNQFTGTLPVELGNLQALNELEVGFNHLTGELPSAYTDLASLEALGVHENMLTGAIPNTIGDLQNLLILFVSNNYFFGTIPSAVTTLQSLFIVNIADNRLTGTLPAGLGDLGSMLQLDVSRNQLSGTIPSAIGDAQRLVQCRLAANLFSGTLPTQLFNISSLNELELDENLLTGTLPVEIGELRSLQVLSVSNNFIIGTIPSSIGSLAAATSIDLQGNQLTGSVPPHLSRLRYLQDLVQSTNYLTGTFPQELTRLQALASFQMAETLLSGSLPANIGNMTALWELSLNDNLLTGQVPSSLTQMASLNSLTLSFNKLSGALTQVFNATTQLSLATVRLDSNRFTGSIPSELFLLPLLQTVVLSDNCFTGALPSSMCDAPLASTYSLNGLHSAHSCRQELFPALSGAYVVSRHNQQSLPACLFTMTGLNTLQLSGNGLTGTLPGTAQLAAALVNLVLSHNKLTGPIPDAVQARTWYNLDLSYNKLDGTLRSGFATGPASLTLQTNRELQQDYSAVVLRNNRLSHDLPSALDSMHDVSVLAGNLFDCSPDRDELPSHDAGREAYSCGSALFDVPYYVYVGLLVAACVAAAIALWRQVPSSTTTASTLQQKVTEWLDVEHWYERNGGEGGDRLQHYKYVVSVQKQICQLALYSALYMVLVFLPMYAALSHFYGTHSYAYAWSVSAAYLSGPTASALEIVFYCGLLTLLAVGCTMLTRTLQDNSPAAHHTSTTGVSAGAGVTREKVCLYGFYAAILVLNIAVVAGVNVGYLLAVESTSPAGQAMLQLALAVFMLLWCNFGLSYPLRWAQQRLNGTTPATTDGLFGLQLFVQLSNLILVPCVVVVLLSPDCLRSALVPTSSVTTSFTYQSCDVFDATTGCQSYAMQTATTSYNPPFSYSYQCSSSLLAYYAPVFVYLSLIVAFVHPLQSLAHCALYKRFGQSTQGRTIVSYCVPRILRIDNDAFTVQSEAPHDPTQLLGDANQFLLVILSYVGVLLTFGVVFPPLAVSMCVAVFSAVYLARIEVGRFLCAAVAANALGYVDAVNAACDGVGSAAQLRQAVGVILFVMGVFYTFFLFDTLGDVQGARAACWVMVVVPLVPVLLWAAWESVAGPRRGESGRAERGQTSVDGSAVRFEMSNVGKAGAEVRVAVSQRDSSGAAELEGGEVRNVLQAPRV